MLMSYLYASDFPLKELNLFPAFEQFRVLLYEKQIDISFLYVCPFTEDKFGHNIVKVSCETTSLCFMVPQPL